MQFKMFQIFSFGDTAREKELNLFLHEHNIVHVERVFVENKERSFWAFCIEYLEDASLNSNVEKERTFNYSEIYSETDKVNPLSVEIAGTRYTFCYCPPGEFWMGSPEDEEGRSENETRRRVKITHGFWMLETPVTQGLYKAIKGCSNCEFQDGAEATSRPVENVSWEDCRLFAKTLNSRDLGIDKNLKFRLPTEAEWEYACRAGTEGAYAGDPEKMGWFKNNSDSQTHEVKQKDPNAWGLYDMHGNVGEWCLDNYREKLGVDDETDPVEFVKDGEIHTVRSGKGYADKASSQRSASRFGAHYSEESSNIGFRLVLSSFDPEGNSGNGAEAESNH